DLAEALLAGPLPPLFDEESAALARGLCEGLALPDERERFARLAALTARHFAREQSIFTHHMGLDPWAPPPPPASALAGLLPRPGRVPAPVVSRDAGGARKLTFRPFRLPRGFDLRDHGARVRAFEEAFVRSVTQDRDDYAVAVDYVLRRFGRPDDDPRR